MKNVFTILICIFIFHSVSAEAVVMGMIKVSGEVISIDLKSQQMTVKLADSKELVFEFDRYAKVFVKGGQKGMPVDIKIGSKVEISYIVQNSKNMALIIKLL